MSIDSTRNQLESARQDLVAGSQHAGQGCEAADDAFSQFAQAETHRNGLLEVSKALITHLAKTEGVMIEVRDGVFKAAKFREDLDETSRKAGASFKMAANSGEAARAKLADVLGEEAATTYDPPAHHSDLAAGHAIQAATRADMAEHRLYEVANQFKNLVRQLGFISAEAILLTNSLAYVDVPESDLMAAIAYVEKPDTNEHRAQAIESTAAALENGTAATEAFNIAIHSVDERLDRL